MNKMTRETASSLKNNMHAVFDTEAGKAVMEYLEQACCWYQSCLVEGSNEHTLINDGKRQVLATIKTILKLNPEQITALVNKGE